jgi:hypothetical protein
LGLAITVAEGITANLRVDFFDDETWGTTGPVGRPDHDGGDIEVDRAFIRIEKDMFIFQGGQLFQAFGNPGAFTAYAPQANGLALRLKLPVTVDVNYFKLDEGTSVIDEEDAQKDTDMYAVQVAYPSEMFTIGGYYVLASDGSELNYEDQNVIGVWGNTKIGPVKVSGALDFFGGSYDANTDYMGTQLWLGGEMAFTEAFNLGANIYYALAADSDGSELQLTEMPNKFAPFEAHEVVFRGYRDCLVSLNGSDTPFDPTGAAAGAGDDAGVMGMDVYGLFTPVENVTLAASIGYFSPQDDDEDVTNWNSSMLVEGSVTWQFAPNCNLMGATYYRSDDMEDDTREDAELGMLALLAIAW